MQSISLNAKHFFARKAKWGIPSEAPRKKIRNQCFLNSASARRNHMVKAGMKIFRRIFAGTLDSVKEFLRTHLPNLTFDAA